MVLELIWKNNTEASMQLERNNGQFRTNPYEMSAKIIQYN